MSIATWAPSGVMRARLRHGAADAEAISPYRGPDRELSMTRFILLAAAVLLSQPAHAQVTLRYGQNAAGTGGLSSLPLNVAQRKDFFRREGINLEVVPIPGGTDRIVAALDKGEIDAGKNATTYTSQAVLKGSDATAFMSQTANPVYSLIVRREI